MIDVATLIPQHDDEGRSATILPGVPLPEWALPAGPIAPEPDPADLVPPASPVEAPAPELVLAGAPARPAEVASAPPPGLAQMPAPTPALAPALEPAPAPTYDAPMPLGANGPGPMRAGWDFPGSDFREQAHDEALAEAAEAAEVAVAEAAAAAARGNADAPIDPALALALTAPLPRLEPLPAPEPVDAVSAVDAVGAVADVEFPEPAAAAAARRRPAHRHRQRHLHRHRPDTDTDETPEDGGEDAVPAAPSSRRTVVALGALGAVVVVGAVAAFVWPGLLVSSDPEPVPVVPPVSAPAAAAPVVLTTPASVGPYTKLTGAPAAALTTAVSGSALPGLSAPVSAVYGTGTTPAITVIAWNSANPVGASAIPSAFAGFQGATSAVVTDISTTPVTASGEMQCGTTVVSGAPASLCFWADGATFGSVTVLEPSSAESAADTAIAVRAAVVGG